MIHACRTLYRPIFCLVNVYVNAQLWVNLIRRFSFLKNSYFVSIVYWWFEMHLFESLSKPTEISICTFVWMHANQRALMLQINVVISIACERIGDEKFSSLDIGRTENAFINIMCQWTCTRSLSSIFLSIPFFLLPFRCFVQQSCFFSVDSIFISHLMEWDWSWTHCYSDSVWKPCQQSHACVHVWCILCVIIFFSIPKFQNEIRKKRPQLFKYTLTRRTRTEPKHR